MRLLTRVACWALLLALFGCSPAFNWRTVRLEGPGVEVLLPCKPDQGSRNVPLAGQSLELSMVGCDAGGATFAVAWAALPEGALPGEALAHWTAATLANMRAAPSPSPSAAGGSVAFVPPGALPMPQALRMQATGQRAGGAPVSADAAWFVRRVGATTYVLDAVVYADKPDRALADTFFAGIRFL